MNCSQKLQKYDNGKIQGKLHYNFDLFLWGQRINEKNIPPPFLSLSFFKCNIILENECQILMQEKIPLLVKLNVYYTLLSLEKQVK